MKIHHCHAHIFTIEHVPDNFLPVLSISWLMRNKLFKPLTDILHNLNPFTDKDSLDRYRAFVEQGLDATQQKIFDDLAKYYQPDTVFVILTMDMDRMEAGNPAKNYKQQLQELAVLKANPHYKDRIIPFVCADPRRADVLDVVKDCIENKGFGGIKLYPPLGYYPFDDRLYGVYEYAVKYNLPIMTHTNKHGVYYRGKLTDEHLKPAKLGKHFEKTNRNKNFAQNFSHPDNYLLVLKDFPTLKLCFAHFGGSDEWEAYLDNGENEKGKESWYYKIKTMLANPAYPNLFTDISYTIGSIKNCKQVGTIQPHLLNLLRETLQDESLKGKILFGSDFYMANIEGGEKVYSEILMQELGTEHFRQIAETNPQKYLAHRSPM